MASRIVALRRRLPRRLRAGGLRLLRRPGPPDLEFRLVVPGTPAGELAIRTPAESTIGRQLLARGLAGHEPESLACYLAALDARGFEPTFDVGANIGVFSWLAALRTPATTVAFEPTPTIADVVRAISTANDLGIIVEEIALGATAGTAQLFLSENSDSSNSLRVGFRPSRRSVHVVVETLDGYVARTGVVPGVLKIDTESTEPDVLRGAARLLAEHRPWLICEVLAGRTEAELTEILGPLNYSWYRIEGPGPLERRTILEGDRSYAHLNWLFAPAPPSDDFWRSMNRWHASIVSTPAPGQRASESAALS
jgi:FkbM family methyltransferase